MISRPRTRPRRLSVQDNRIQLMIFSEGRKTESIYLTNWYRLYRDAVIVNIATHEHTTPFELAESAATQRRHDLREANRGRGAAFHQYWCIFDVDEHPKIPEALDLAGANNINVALSSPCLELWFLIHFEDQTAYLDRREAQRQSRAILGCDKVLNQAALDRLVANYSIAKSRARALGVKHIGDGSPRPWNPYSDVWTLVDVVRGSAT